ncbi:MAG: sulfite exporter TauE/SafE family protein [Bacteroidetes bacterium]|nr:sulfite exporter TauE/SafE family protein [Bacteroidota bacterium]
MEVNQILLLLIVGLISGILSGLLGIGGAVFIIPALAMVMGYSQQTAQGTTLMMMTLPVGLMAAIQYYKAGHGDIKTAGILAVAFFIGGYFGGKFANQIPQEILKKIFAILLLIIAFKMLFFDKAIKI